MMHQIASHLVDHSCHFTPYYADGIVDFLARTGLLNNTILGGRHYSDTIKYLNEHHLSIDIRGFKNQYDLVVTGSDAIIPRNIKSLRIVLVQEGMTEPEGIMYHLVRWLHLPRWLGNTSTTGLSMAYDAFCVASKGYKELFIHKGIKSEKIVVTGIPNFDNLADLPKSQFPYSNFVLVATTPNRETWRPELRSLFITRCVQIANGRQLIFKLHPLENAFRAIKEIKTYAPSAKVFWRGNINDMIQKAEIVITQRSSCTFIAMALGKEVYSEIKTSQLQKLMPIQNGGTSAIRIAQVCRQIIQKPKSLLIDKRTKYHLSEFLE